MIVAKTLATLVHCCTSANFQSVCLLFFMFFFFALFFNVLYEPNYFFTSNTSNRSINIRSTIFILATCYFLISIPSSEYIFFIVLSFFAFIWSNDYVPHYDRHSKEGMDLLNYIVILGKTYLWTCRCKGINPIFNHFKNILEIKYETEKYIAFKTNKIRQFKKKWEMFEVFNLI